MLRRFVSGLVWGGVVAGLGLAVISQVAPRPANDITPPKAEASAPAAGTSADAPAETTAKAADPAPQATAEPAKPAEDKVDPTPAPAVPAAAEPAEATATKAPDAPSAAAELAKSPAVVAAPAEAPAAPAGSADDPGAAPTVAPVGAAPTKAPQAEEPANPPMAEAAPATPEAPPPAKDDPLLAAPMAEAPAKVATADPAPATAAPPTPAPVAPAPAAPEPPAPDLPAPKIDAADAPRLITPETDPDLPGKVAQALPDVQPGSSSLPQIGEAPAAAPATEPLPEAAVIEDLPPIAAFARPFDNPEAKPLFAVLLVDDGRPDLDRQSLAALPFPVTFVVDPLAPDAAKAAAIYRAGLQEVVIGLSGLPDGGTAADAEQTLQAVAATLPETVAMIDLPGQFQEDRDLASAIVPILQEQGRGLLTFDRGLNAADQIARRSALPTATVFRTLDADGESLPTMRRYLDRAAFKAAQEGRVIVLGTTRPETVAALLEWTVEGRAASVALAPVTAVLATP